MQAFRTEIIAHMLDAVEARQFSVLFNQPSHWKNFTDWCNLSPVALRIMEQSSDDVEMVCLDQSANLYCVAMTMNTLETLVKNLVEAYEDEDLERMFS